MCEWSAADLLGRWHQRSLATLEGLGTPEFRALGDGSKAVVELKGPAFVASVTAWSTGMLELILLGTNGGSSAAEPEVVTEQREARSQADALLDQWLVLLRGLGSPSS